MKYLLNILLFLAAFVAIVFKSTAQEKMTTSQFTIARMKYSGGGDWYNDPSSIPNMLRFLHRHTSIRVADEERHLSIMDHELFAYPFLFMTGHGRISFSAGECERLAHYLKSGGFLFADDDYGMDQYFRREMKKVFPDKEMVEVPFSHNIFFNHFEFPNGLPKIHEHDPGPPKGYAYFHEGRMVVFYSFNTNISDGWADPDVHGDPQSVRDKAFEMGTNIIIYALTQ